jgi:hypothetical protein
MGRPRLKFDHSVEQVLEFARYLDWIYDQQVSLLDGDPDIQKVIIFRSVNVSWLEHGRGCSASSLASALRIPRETVRRKCEVLVDEHWLVKTGDQFQPGRRARAISAFVDDSIDRLLILADRIRALDQ